MVKLQGNNLELTIFATGGGTTQRRQRPLSLTLFLHTAALSLHSYTNKSGNTKMSNNNKTVCPKSYLYTYDFRAIYIYSLEGSWQTY